MNAEAASQSTAAHQIKASLLRGYLGQLEREGQLEVVLARLPPLERELLQRPPPASTWVSAEHTERISVAIADVLGLPGFKRFSRAATLHGMIPVLRGAVEGFLRLFGATPATLFSRLKQLTASTTRGLEYDYTPTGARSGILTLRYEGRRDVPRSNFYGAAGGMEVAFDLCRAREGEIGEPELIADGRNNAARYVVRW